jgi:hypothetical protein
MTVNKSIHGDNLEILKTLGFGHCYIEKMKLFYYAASW